MRTEELLKEAETFKGKNESAYLHAEFYDGERGSAITVGSLASITLAVWSLIESSIHAAMPEDTTKREYFRALRTFLHGLRMLYSLSKKQGGYIFPASSFFSEVSDDE